MPVDVLRACHGMGAQATLNRNVHDFKGHVSWGMIASLGGVGSSSMSNRVTMSNRGRFNGRAGWQLAPWQVHWAQRQQCRLR